MAAAPGSDSETFEQIEERGRGFPKSCSASTAVPAPIRDYARLRRRQDSSGACLLASPPKGCRTLSPQSAQGQWTSEESCAACSRNRDQLDRTGSASVRASDASGTNDTAIRLCLKHFKRSRNGGSNRQRSQRQRRDDTHPRPLARQCASQRSSEFQSPLARREAVRCT
jgi:hypothetical protein